MDLNGRSLIQFISGVMNRTGATVNGRGILQHNSLIRKRDIQIITVGVRHERQRDQHSGDNSRRSTRSGFPFEGHSNRP